jgi:hypothetical protein
MAACRKVATMKNSLQYLLILDVVAKIIATNNRR